MKKLYFWSNQELQFKLVSKKKYIIKILLILCLLVMSFFTGRLTHQYSVVNCIEANKLLTVGTQEWKDSVFKDYEDRAEIYLSKIHNTPIEAGMLRLAAYNAYDSTGILLPVELAIAQAQIESSLGLKGRSPTNNPYNIGEYDNGTVIWFSSTFSGIQSYYYLMCKNYLKCKSVNTLLKSFRNCNGQRYASSTLYEKSVSSQMNSIKKYTDSVIRKKK